MWIELASLGFLILDGVYHRLTDDEPVKPKPEREITLPRVDEGGSVQLLYGRDRIRAPILAQCNSPGVVTVPEGDTQGRPAGFLYHMSMFFILGIPFEDGVNKIHRIFVGERALLIIDQSLGVFNVPLDSLTGDGEGEWETAHTYLGTRTFFASNDPTGSTDETQQWIEGTVEFLNGNPAQRLVDDVGVATTAAGTGMLDEGLIAAEIPGYRGYMCAYLYGSPIDSTRGWKIGYDHQVSGYSFECSSYPVSPLFGAMIGDEANPADVILDILKAFFAKLHIDESHIDNPSFIAAATVLFQEEHGYSMALDSGRGSDVIMDILKQIDATLYVDPDEGTIKIKLIRDDYTFSTLKRIDPSNGKLKNFTFSGHEGLVNKIRVVFPNREARYQDDSATAMDHANAAGEDGIITEVVLRQLGCKTPELAATIAARELSARSRPIAKCTATVDRSFFSMVPGDVVVVNWPEWGIANMVMRVGSINRKTPDANDIDLGLIQDFYYVNRSAITPPPISPFPPVVLSP